MEWYIFAILVAFFVSLSSILTKKVLIKEHAMEYVTVFSLFVFILFLPFVSKLDFNFPNYYWGLILIAAVLESSALLLAIKSFRHMEISSITPLMILGPVIHSFLAFFFLSETLSFNQIGGLSLVLVGAYFLETKSKQLNFHEPFKNLFSSKYVLYILIALIFYGAGGTITRFLLYNPSPINIYTLLFFIQLIVATFFIFSLYFFYDGFEGIKKGVKTYGYLIALISLLTLFDRLLYLKALTFASGKIGLVSTIKRSSVFFIVVIGGKLFHDKHLIHKLFSSLIMFIGLYLMLI